MPRPGMNDYIPKPVDPLALSQVLERRLWTAGRFAR